MEANMISIVGQERDFGWTRKVKLFYNFVGNDLERRQRDRGKIDDRTRAAAMDFGHSQSKYVYMHKHIHIIFSVLYMIEHFGNVMKGTMPNLCIAVWFDMGLLKLTEYMNVIIIVKTFHSAKLCKKSFLELHFGNNIAYNKTPTHT